MSNPIIVIQTFDGFTVSYYTFDRWEEIGLKKIENTLHSFELIDEKLFEYGVIKFEIQFSEYIPSHSIHG